MRKRWMHAILILTCGRAIAQEPAEILGRVRHNVAEQVSRAANYACVETIERNYLVTRDVAAACGSSSIKHAKPYMHDRLRLDVAVSQRSEIYSWHGENNFTSASVAEVVRSGPISSGGFVGYLMNIFLEPNIAIAYVGQSKGIARFRYEVPLAHSKYQTSTPKSYARIPFHGEFGVDTKNFQLKDLIVTGEDFPSASDICFAETHVSYQIAHISGADSLIPSGFLLRIANRLSNLFTESRGAYSDCREFKGESTIVFDTSGEPSKGPQQPPASRQKIPAGRTLPIRLITPIDDRKSFTGDRVEGVVVEPSGNSVVHGVITELAAHYDPATHYYLKIEFEQMESNGQIYSLRALHKPTGNEAEKLYLLFGDNLPEAIKQELNGGTMIFDSKHLHLDPGFTADWITIEPRPN